MGQGASSSGSDSGNASSSSASYVGVATTSQQQQPSSGSLRKTGNETKPAATAAHGTTTPVAKSPPFASPLSLLSDPNPPSPFLSSSFPSPRQTPAIRQMPTAPTPFPLIKQPQSLLQKVIWTMMKGDVFTKYPFTDGKPVQSFIFFSVLPRPLDHSTTDSTFGALYWNSNATVFNEAKTNTNAQPTSTTTVAAAPIPVKQEEKYDGQERKYSEEEKTAIVPSTASAPSHDAISSFPSSLNSPFISPTDVPFNGARYERSSMRCIPIVSVVDVLLSEIHDASVSSSAAAVVSPSSTGVTAAPSLTKQPSTLGRTLSAHSLGLNNTTSNQSQLSQSSNQPSTHHNHHHGIPRSAALSESFKRWTHNPLINAEDFRLARKQRRERRKLQRKRNAEKIAAGLVVTKEEEVSSDSDDEEWGAVDGEGDDEEWDEEEDFPKYIFTPPDPSLCFSIITMDRTLDLVAHDRDTRDMWALGIRMLAHRGDTSFNELKPLTNDLTSSAISMTVSAAVNHQTSKIFLSQLKKRDSNFFRRFLKKKDIFKSSKDITGTESSRTPSIVRPQSARDATSALPTPIPENAPVLASSFSSPAAVIGAIQPLNAQNTGSNNTSSSNAAGDKKVFGVEIEISCRHLSPRGSTAISPMVLLYGVLKPEHQPNKKQHVAQSERKGLSKRYFSSSNSLSSLAGRKGGESQQKSPLRKSVNSNQTKTNAITSKALSATNGKTQEQKTPSNRQSSLGIYLGKSERITSAAGDPNVTDVRHPNFSTKLVIKELDKYQRFYFCVHDVADLPPEGQMTVAGTDADTKPTLATRKSSFAFIRSPSLRSRPSITRQQSNASTKISPPPPPTFDQILKQFEATPLLGQVSLTYDEVIFGLGREVVAHLHPKERLKLPSIAALTRHFVPPISPAILERILGSKHGQDKSMIQSATTQKGKRQRLLLTRGRGGGVRISHPVEDDGRFISVELPFVAANDITSKDLFLKDKEGKTIVTDAMLDAYKAVVMEKHTTKEPLSSSSVTPASNASAVVRPALERPTSMGVTTSLGMPVPPRSKLTPLLLLRIQPKLSELSSGTTAATAPAAVVVEAEQRNSFSNTEIRRSRASIALRASLSKQFRRARARAKRRASWNSGDATLLEEASTAEEDSEFDDEDEDMSPDEEEARIADCIIQLLLSERDAKRSVSAEPAVRRSAETVLSPASPDFRRLVRRNSFNGFNQLERMERVVQATTADQGLSDYDGSNGDNKSALPQASSHFNSSLIPTYSGFYRPSIQHVLRSSNSNPPVNSTAASSTVTLVPDLELSVSDLQSDFDREFDLDGPDSLDGDEDVAQQPLAPEDVGAVVAPDPELDHSVWAQQAVDGSKIDLDSFLPTPAGPLPAEIFQMYSPAPVAKEEEREPLFSFEELIGESDIDEMKQFIVDDGKKVSIPVNIEARPLTSPSLEIASPSALSPASKTIPSPTVTATPVINSPAAIDSTLRDLQARMKRLQESTASRLQLRSRLPMLPSREKEVRAGGIQFQSLSASTASSTTSVTDSSTVSTSISLHQPNASS